METWTGIDISRYQTHIKCYDSTISFVIIKATEGETLIDRKFKQHWNSIPPNIHKGAYHFFRPNKSGLVQANVFLKTVNFKPDNIAPVIDVEWTRDYSKTSTNIRVRNLKLMISQIKKQTGCKPIIYTSQRFWDKYYAPYFSKKDIKVLWVADYRPNKSPNVPSTWSDWHIWQYTQSGNIYGYKGCVDLNISKIHPKYLTIKESLRDTL
jgi:lysozyme